MEIINVECEKKSTTQGKGETNTNMALFAHLREIKDGKERADHKFTGLVKSSASKNN